MADISSWRLTLESSGFVVDPDRLATDLYESSLRIFFRLIEYPSENPADIRAIRTQLQRYRLWGCDFDAREGGLDQKIARSERLKDALLPVLVRMAEALLEIAYRKCLATELEDIFYKIRALSDQCPRIGGGKDLQINDNDIDPFQLLSVLDEITSSGSETSIIHESDEVEELLGNIQSCNDCLFRLGSVLQDSAEEVLPEAKQPQDTNLSTPDLVHNTAWAYISGVLEAYPSIDPQLARRLGEANEERYNRLQRRREIACAKCHAKHEDSIGEGSDKSSSCERTTQRASTKPARSESTFASTEISSVFDTFKVSTSERVREKRKKAPLSVTTFASSLESDNRQVNERGIPKMPDDHPWGTPFNCTLCGDLLSNVWSSAQWM